MKKMLLKLALFVLAFFGLQQTVSALSFGWGGGHHGRRGYHRRRGYGGLYFGVGRRYPYYGTRTVVVEKDDDDDEEIDDLERENRKLRRKIEDLEERLEDLENK